MSQRNETRYTEALQRMRDGASDMQIRHEFGFNPYVITSLRESLADKGPEF